MTAKTKSRGTAKGSKRLVKAKRDFQKMQEEVATFTTKRRFVESSTTGKWSHSAALELNPNHKEDTRFARARNRG